MLITTLTGINTAKSMCNNYIPLFIKYSDSKTFKICLEKISKENEKQILETEKIIQSMEPNFTPVNNQKIKKKVVDEFGNFIYNDSQIHINHVSVLFFLVNIEIFLVESLAEFKELTKRLNFYHKDNLAKIIISLNKNIGLLKKTTQILIDRG